MERQTRIIAMLKNVNDKIEVENANVSLIENGLIDSLSIVQLIGEIEDTFDIELDDEDMTIENFATVVAIETLVNKYSDS